MSGLEGWESSAPAAPAMPLTFFCSTIKRIDAPGRWPYNRFSPMDGGAMAPGIAKTTPSRARNERLEARVSSEQKALFQRAAELQGRSLTDFVISSVHDAAVRTIEEVHLVRLNADESQAFAEALLNPREPTDRLRAAARRYLETIDR